MKRALVAGTLVVLLLVLSGCTFWRVPVQPPRGLLVTHYVAPLTDNVGGVTVAENSGRASSFYVRDIIFTGQGIAWGDISVRSAAMEGQLSHIEYADYEIIEILGLFGQMTVRAYGR